MEEMKENGFNIEIVKNPIFFFDEKKDIEAGPSKVGRSSGRTLEENKERKWGWAERRYGNENNYRIILFMYGTPQNYVLFEMISLPILEINRRKYFFNPFC